MMTKIYSNHRFFLTHIYHNHSVFTYLLSTIFFILSFVGVINHEIWGDEAQAWLIARDSVSLPDLYKNLRYEGHPGLWYICLFFISRFTTNPLAMQIFHILIATSAIYLFILFSPFNQLQKILFTFGYFPFYEYNIISRSYGLGLLLIILFCIFFTQENHNFTAITVVIVLLANTNAYSFLIACSLATTILLDKISTYKSSFWNYLNKQKLYFYITLTVIGMIIAIYQIIPPEDALFKGGNYWKKPDIVFQLKNVALTIRALWKSYIPIPQLFTYHFWNTSIIETSNFTKFFGCLGSLIIFAFSTLWFLQKPIVMWLYLSSSIAILFFTYSQYLGGIRHYGHLFLIFIACLWIAKYYKNTYSLNHQYFLLVTSKYIKKLQNIFFIALLCIHTIVGLSVFTLDLLHPFSASKAVSEYIAKNKLNEENFLIGKQDYMVSVISTYLQNKIYYSESSRFGSFINWNNRQKIDNAISVNRINQIIHSRQQDAILILTDKVYLEFPNLKVTKLSSFHNSIVERESYDLYLLQRKYLPNSS